MSQNYNLNSSFGLNVTGSGAKVPAYKQGSETDQYNNLFNSNANFVDKYENVLSGDVEKEINMYSRQAMIVGMSLRAADNTIRRFDTNI